MHATAPIAIIDFMNPLQKAKGRRPGFFTQTAASKCFGQPLPEQQYALSLSVELNFLLDHLRQNGSPVLDAQAFNFAMPQIAAKADKLPPCRAQHLAVT